MPRKSRATTKTYSTVGTQTSKRRGTRARGIRKGQLTAPNLHRFVRTATYSNLSNTSVSGIITKGTDAMLITLSSIGAAIQYGAGSIYFTLDSLPNYTEFSYLFDSYQINKVSVKFTPFFSQSAAGAAASATSAQCAVLWHDVVDTDDAGLFAATDAGLQEMRQYRSYKTRLVANGRSFSKKLTPLAAMPAYAAGAFNGYTRAPKNAWYDMVNLNTQMYGYKWIVEATNPGSNMVLYVKCEVKMKLSCKDVR